VFEAGLGVSRSMWGAVVPLVAGATSAVVYDRSGLGRSPADPAPRTLDRLAADLGAVLDHLGSGPFVLVGHSWGGPVVRVAASARPDRVAGLVLVDPTDEGCDLFFSAANQRQNRMATVLLPPLARTGLLRLPVRRMAASLPEPAASEMRAEDGGVASARAQVAELAGVTDGLRRLRDEPLAGPGCPLVVISGTVTSRMERGRRPALVEAHAARARSVPGGRHVRAERSSHLVPFSEPEVVAAEILSVVEGAR
jgi:pimeloyl-ACP methyl ester carboxylesterase